MSRVNRLTIALHILMVYYYFLALLLYLCSLIARL